MSHFLSISLRSAVAVAVFGIVVAARPAVADNLYSNGFETDTAGWNYAGSGYEMTRVASGTDGITAASGGYFGESTGTSGAATNWGGYNFGAGSVPTAFRSYTTSLQIYLDVSGSVNNGALLDYSSSISNSSGGFLRDFIFNAIYLDATNTTDPGTGNRFVISASNNSDPSGNYDPSGGASPVVISTTGWYTFENSYSDLGGFLSDQMTIADADGTQIASWTRTTTDPIASVGGNRYGWFPLDTLPVTAFDNASLNASAVPEPASMALLGAGLVSLATIRRRRRNRA